MTEVIEASDLKYDARGLIPCVVQQYDTGEVLMVAWMNEESVGLTTWTSRSIRSPISQGCPVRPYTL